ncbi:MAG: tRNA pseudouridine(38-40) synthase TruA [Gammaproteobacteria bacterium CG22_combo_CG10-13_8_21_14_all_40_8]|nr:MAG: tRNA pseudouridine(38-40) synthase TruA [Gammaproteobacteria bacterium CG22_combo_CG10-13_8_21_14_all_40_8]
MNQQQTAQELLTYRVALGVEYCGLNYCGWQFQKHSIGVQQRLEEALSTVADHKIQTVCAGRTDTGVHAVGQVVHFETHSQRPLKAWTLGTNANLPDDISVTWAKVVADDFSARFSATNRSYRYVLLNRLHRSALLNGRVTKVATSLNIEAMQLACPYFLGEQDFSSIRAANCQSNTPWRNISRLEVSKQGDFVVIDVTANAFLYHMVRNIVGVLLSVGQGQHSPEWVKSLLDAKDRTKAPATAPASGLYLTMVEYPTAFDLPITDSRLFLMG